MTRRRRILSLIAACALAVLVAPPLWVELFGRDASASPGTTVVAAGDHPIYVADWGHHTSILVDDATGGFTEHAWGDRRFYMESRYAPWSVFATLFLPTESVTYVERWRGDALPPRGARAVWVRRVDTATHDRLVAELDRQRRANEPYPHARGYDGTFFPARGWYLWSNDCNRWTVERLAAVGLARAGRGVALTRQVPARLVGFTRVR